MDGKVRIQLKLKEKSRVLQSMVNGIKDSLENPEGNYRRLNRPSLEEKRRIEA